MLDAVSKIIRHPEQAWCGHNLHLPIWHTMNTKRKQNYLKYT